VISPLPLSPNRFLPRLQAAGKPQETGRTERVLAAARVMLVMAAIVALALDPVEPARFARLAYLLSGLYLLYSLLVLVWLQYHPRPTRQLQVWLQAIDVIWPLALSVFTTGLGAPFLLFYFFALLESAYRWGFKETLMTTAAMVGLVLARDFLKVSGPGVEVYWRKTSPWALFFMQGPYFAIMGTLVGYLGEWEKVPGWMAVARVRALAGIQARTSLRGAVRASLQVMCMLAGARRAMIVLEETATERAFLWDAQVSPGAESGMVLASYELSAAQRACYLFNPPGNAWHVVRHKERPGRAPSFDLLALSGEGERLRRVAWELPKALLAAHPFRSLMGIAAPYGRSWSVEVLLFDTDLGSGRAIALRFFQALCQQISPVIYGIFVTHRLRSRAGAVERARVARELHDGAIQSLISLEMQVDVLRRRPELQETEWVRELGSLQSLLRGEILGLRELMQAVRPLDLGPKQLLEFLAFTVDKFRNETNIMASFVSSLEDVRLPPRVCSELGRIVQEALVNVRRHSGARNVVVRFESNNGMWKLVVDDDGRGFDFSGRWSHAQLDAARKGPLVIKERVRAIQGELTVESLPGSGARLEITLPHQSDER
jgi:signal transduction histidine kinase